LPLRNKAASSTLYSVEQRKYIAFGRIEAEDSMIESLEYYKY